VSSRLSGKGRQRSWFSQGVAATLFECGGRICNCLVWNLLLIIYTKHYWNQFIFHRKM